MFFDEITLSRKSWHYRLQSFMFGSPPYTNNFCPYFWLTCFCLLVSPFVFCFVGVVGAIRFLNVLAKEYFLKPFDEFMEKVEENVCIPYVDNKMRELSDEYVLKLWQKVRGYDYSSSKAEKFHRWQETMTKDGVNWRKRLNELIAAAEERRQREWEEKREREAKEYEREIKRKRRQKELYAKIIKYTKWVSFVFVAALCVAGVAVVTAITYFFYRFVHWLFLLACTIPFKEVFIFSGYFAGFAAVVSVVGFIGYKAIRKLIKCLPYLFPDSKPKKKPQIITPIVLSIATLFVKIGQAIVTPFEIFVEYVKVFKQNNCPAIKWKDD